MSSTVKSLPRACGPLTGTVVVPGDKSLSHRAALLAPLAAGPSRASGWLDAADTRRSLQAVRDLGARTQLDRGALTIWPGVYPRGADTGVPLAIDCGNSGTTARLLTGLLAGIRGEVILSGDASLRTRPMKRVVDPLIAMGADIAYLQQTGRLPFRVRGRPLHGVDHALAIPSAQVASALIVAGLSARGTTQVSGGGRCRDHTPRLLLLMGAAVGYLAGEDCTVDGGRLPLLPFDIEIPGDPSSAAFWLGAAALIAGSRLTVAGHLLNPTRTGLLSVLQRAGATVTITRRSPGEWPSEPSGDVTISGGGLQGFRIEPDEVPTLIDELPLLAVIATQAEGESVVTGAAEARRKESDRLAVVVRELRRLGARIEERPDGFRVVGPTPLTSDGETVLVTAGDHRIAMALAVAALVTDGQTALDDADCVDVSYPGFFADLEQLIRSGRDGQRGDHRGDDHG